MAKARMIYWDCTGITGYSTEVHWHHLSIKNGIYTKMAKQYEIFHVYEPIYLSLFCWSLQ